MSGNTSECQVAGFLTVFEFVDQLLIVVQLQLVHPVDQALDVSHPWSETELRIKTADSRREELSLQLYLHLRTFPWAQKLYIGQQFMIQVYLFIRVRVQDLI